MKKVLLIIISVIMILNICVVFAGCKNDENGEITIVDMEGTEVKVNNNISRVACISQSATDLMIAFGLGDKIVGTYRSFTYNSWTTEIYPASANYKAYSYSVLAEELLADEIELVIIQDTENAEAFRNAGLPVVAIHQYSPTGAFDDEVYDVAKIIGEIFNKENEANAWIQDVQNTILDIESKIGTIDNDKAVYYVNGEKAKGLFYSDGGNSMISRILDVANVKLATEKYEVLNVHKVSDEEMISLDPYSIIIGGVYQNNLIDSLNSSPVWSGLTCVAENRVYRIPVAMVGIENVSAETPVMLKYMANLFDSRYEFDIDIELKANIKKYFNYDLTSNDVINMCNGLNKNGDRMVDES